MFCSTGPQSFAPSKIKKYFLIYVYIKIELGLLKISTLFLESDTIADVGGTTDGVERKQTQQRRPAFGYLVPRRLQKNHTDTTNCPTFLDLKKCPRR